MAQATRMLVAGFVVLVCLLGIPVSSYAAKGTVVKTSSSCDYFIVETPRGFALLEWYRGCIPDEGDTIVGGFESYGFKDVFDLTQNREVRVWVEDYWLTWERAVEELFDHCD